MTFFWSYDAVRVCAGAESLAPPGPQKARPDRSLICSLSLATKTDRFTYSLLVA